MFQSQQQQQQQQQREYEHGNTAGTSVSEWVDDYTRLETKFNEYNTELTKFSNKYGCANVGNHHMLQTGAASPMPSSKKRERWSDEERQLFVIGLAKYGRGRWKNISENVLPSKTPSQIASHAQKYFIRQDECALNKKRRRSSIHDHDIITTTVNNECHDQAMLSFVHSQKQDSSVPPPLPPPPYNNNMDDDVAAPQDHQLHQPTVVIHAAEKESSCDEAMVLPHHHVDLSPLPHDYWDQLPDIVDVPPLCDDQQELQQQQQMYGYGTCDIITRQEEEPIFINYINSLSHSPFDNIAFPGPEPTSPPRFA